MTTIAPFASSEDDAIRSALATCGGHLWVAPFGCTLYYGRGSTISGYDGDRMKAKCIAAGLPVIDTRAADCAMMARAVIGGPMVAVGEPVSPQPWHALSYAPLEHVAATYAAAGAEIHNIPGCRGGASVSTPEEGSS